MRYGFVAVLVAFVAGFAATQVLCRRLFLRLLLTALRKKKLRRSESGYKSDQHGHETIPHVESPFTSVP